MKKIINRPEDYTDDMLRGIYAAHSGIVKYVNDDLRCYCAAYKKPGKVAIITGGGTGHLPLFLGYVGEGLLDGCGVGGVFQSPSAEQIYNISRAVEAGAGILYLYGNYTGDIMNFDMAAEMCEMDGIVTKSIVGADDVNSAPAENAGARRGVALEEVLAVAKKAKERTRTVGFALTPCVIPELGKSNFELGENEMAMGMGIHGEPGVWNGPVRTADELAKESLDTILGDMPVASGEEVALLVNGLGATSLEELYILSGAASSQLTGKGVHVYRTFVGEYATSMEMAGASISLMRLDGELKELLDAPAHTPFYTQV